MKKIRTFLAFETDVGTFRMKDAPEVASAFRRATKRKDGNPDRRFKTSHKYLAMFRAFNDRKRREWLAR